MNDKEYNKQVAMTILSQLGGNKFLVMTGAKNLMVIENGISMKLPRNKSKANYLDITLNSMDLYVVRFHRVSGGVMNKKTYEFSPIKREDVKVLDGVFFDMLQEIFTEVTGMYTRLF